MRKTSKWNSLSRSFRAFLILALLFLAIGLGTLGAVSHTGKAYGLWTKGEGDEQQPAIVFSLSNLTAKDKSGNTVTTYLSLKKVYVNVAAVYGEPGEAATLRLGRAYSATSSFSSYVEGSVANVGYEAPSSGTAAVQNALSNWVQPFRIPESGWNIRDYRYFRLISSTHNILINEIVFVGEKLDADGKGTGAFCVIPATVYTGDATMVPFEQQEGESRDHARERELEKAKALLDAQQIPSDAQTTFFRFSEREAYTLMTLREMQAGGSYDARNIGKYRGDTVYGALGADILYLGTLIFGMSPFGLRFFPMLASFGVLVIGFFLTKRLTKSEEAGFVFALLYALGDFAFGFGRLGTPLAVGLFFFVLALDLMHRFYANGMKRADFASAAPVALSALFAVCAILVNGVWLIPSLGILALFVAGAVRQKNAMRYRLDRAIEEAEEEAAASADTEDGAPKPATAKRKAAAIAAEARFKERTAPVLFVLFALVGALLVSALSMYPVLAAYGKLYDDPANPRFGLYGLLWQCFKGGYAGGTGAWGALDVLFRGSGSLYAVAGISFNLAATFAAAFGIVFACFRVISILRGGKPEKTDRTELRGVVIPLIGFVLSLVCSFFGGGAAAFRGLAWVFGFILFAGGRDYFATSEDGRVVKAVRILSAAGLVLLALCFCIAAFFTFSIPLPAAFMNALFK